MKQLLILFFAWLSLSSASASSQISFLLGPSQSKEAGEFGGTNYYVGLGVQGEFSRSAFWLLQLRGDSLGKDSVGVKKDRVSWMVGSGLRSGVISLALGLGAIDTMTTVSFDPDKTVIDPFTGVTLSSDESGISHAVLGGYMARIAIDLAQTGNLRLSGEAAYFNTINKSPYGSYSSLGLNFGMEF